MTLQKYLKDSRKPTKRTRGSVGVESDWLAFCTIKVPNGAVWAGDAGFSWTEATEGEGCVVDVPAGTYRVEAKGMDFGGVKLVSRLRACLNRVKSPLLGEEIDTAGTDSAQIGVCDPWALKAAFEAVCGDDEDKALDLLKRQLHSAYGIIRPDPDGEGTVAFVPSGFGDGSGPVFELLSRSKRRVGIELEFIAAGQTY